MWVDNGYLRTKYEGRNEYVHRIVFFEHHGYWPEYVDHKDQDKLNNAIENLRDVSQSTNLRNQKKIKGYHFHKQSKKWRAQFSLKGKVYHVGMFKTEEAARQAYLNAIGSLSEQED
jgi:hypothetical protein